MSFYHSQSVSILAETEMFHWDLTFFMYFSKCLPLVLFLAAHCNWQVSSLSETKAHQLMQQKAVSFIRFNQQQLSRIYPSSYRVDSSNFNPQPFWNAGCQLGMKQPQLRRFFKVLHWFFFLSQQKNIISVALNYQTEGRVLQLNRAKFYSNGNCGYVLKPGCMCEGPTRLY